ncbi:hypothetical protein [Peterkaempfera bronchialis]|uniref:trypsin-like serine peptidase n=1 Tax=Peterkaempfera bronchialis TaxID=2126346 RepID=UPI003C2B7BA9
MHDQPPPPRRVRLRLPLAAAVLLAAFLAPQAGAADQSAGGGADYRPTAAAAGPAATPAQAARIHRYWTDARLHRARPAPLPHPRGGRHPTPRPRPEAALPARTIPGSAPRRAQPDTAAPSRTAVVSAARRWGGQGLMPARTIGQLFFTTPAGDFRCTASVINSVNRNMVWTSGHCVHPGGGGPGAYYRNFVFVPDADNGLAPHGPWLFRYAATTRAWQQYGDWHYDLAAIAFHPQPVHGNLADYLGAQGARFGSGQDHRDVVNFGFPADGYRRTDFDGGDLWYCEGPTSAVGATGTGMVMRCDMGHGCSGGPWIDDLRLDRGWGYIVGTNSRRDVDADGNWSDDLIYSAYHGNAAMNVYTEVSAH